MGYFIVEGVHMHGVPVKFACFAIAPPADEEDAKCEEAEEEGAKRALMAPKADDREEEDMARKSLVVADAEEDHGKEAKHKTAQSHLKGHGGVRLC